MHALSESILVIIESIAVRLEANKVTQPYEYAWWILEAITQKTKSYLIAHNAKGLNHEQQEKLAAWLTALIDDHMPLSYLIGTVPFGDLEIIVTPPTLIPRPETEEWCLDLITLLKTLDNKKITILDLCVGSGCIALSLAKALPRASVYGVDISNTALALARQNAVHNRITNVQFFCSDLFTALSPTFTFDLIVANPPYIAEAEWLSLAPSVTEWEDKKALVADDEGFALIEEIIKKTPNYIQKNNEFGIKNIPNFMIEIGYTQGQQVVACMQKYGYSQPIIHKDMAGKDRVVSGRCGETV